MSGKTLEKGNITKLEWPANSPAMNSFKRGIYYPELFTRGSPHNQVNDTAY